MRMARLFSVTDSAITGLEGREFSPAEFQWPSKETASHMIRNKVLKDTVLLNASNLIGQFMSVVQGLVIMRCLDPEKYGLWLGLCIILTYSGHVHLGLEYGLGARLPYYQGQANSERAAQTEDTVYIVWTGMIILFSIGIFIYAILGTVSSSIERIGLIALCGIVFFEQQIRYLSRWQTTALKDFSLVSYLAVVRNIISFVFVVSLAYFLNVTGVIIGAFAVAGIMAVIWWIKCPYRFRWRFSPNVLREMFRVGFPILLVGLGGLAIETADRILILNYLGPTFLGYYGVTGLGGNFVCGLLMQAGSAMGPHMAEEMGRSGDSPKALEKFLVKPTILFAYASVTLLTPLFFGIPLLVELLLPKFIKGLPAFYLFIPGLFFLAITITANNILNLILISMKRQRIVIYIQVAAIIIQVLCALFFIRLGMDIVGVALASTIAYSFYGISIVGVAAIYVLPEQKRRLTFLIDVVTPFAYGGVVTLLLLWVGWHWFQDSPVLRAFLQMIMCGLMYIPMFLWLISRVDIRKEFAQIIESVKRRMRSFAPRAV